MRPADADMPEDLHVLVAVEPEAEPGEVLLQRGLQGIVDLSN